MLVAHDRAYTQYLKSPKWRRLRREVFIRDGYTCQRCGAQGRVNAHHLTYERLFNERLEDLVTWCASCHKTHHDDIKAAKLRRKAQKQRKRGVTTIAATPGVCRTCGAASSGAYCGERCRQTGDVFNRVRQNSAA